MSATNILGFFDEPDNKGRERIIPMAGYSILWRCGNKETREPGCGANLPTEDLESTTVRCTKCGKVWSFQQIAWSGQVH